MEKTSSNIRSLSYVLYFSYPTAPLFYKYVTLFSTLRVMQIKEKTLQGKMSFLVD